MELDAFQKPAAETLAPNAVVLAGAGSGKTRVLVARVSFLIKNMAAEPERIAAITFTNAGSAVMRRRWQPGATPGFCGTLHGLLLRYVIAEGKTVLAQEDADELLLEEAKLANYRESKQPLFDTRQSFWKHIGTPAREMTRAQSVVQSYYQKLISAGMLDYDGILWLGLSLLKQGAATLPFTHILWDEFQDSGEADMEVLNVILARCCVSSLFIVGDSDQSIYGFRGGRVENILNIAQSPQFERHQLVYNYRSAIGIVGLANRLIAHNPRLTGTVPCVSTRNEKGTGNVKYYGSPIAQNEGIAELVAGFISAGTAPERIAILARTHGIIEGLKETLPGRGIPFSFGEAKKLPKEWVLLKLAVAIMRQPNNWNLWRIWNRRAEKIGHHNYAESMGTDAPATPGALMGLPANPSPAEALNHLSKFGLSIAAISVVRDWLREHPAPDLESLLLALSNEEVQAKPGGEGVYVGTIHSAKGREWETVILAGFEQGVLPMGKDIQEERRLAYVGITRAETNIVFCASDSRVFQFGPAFTEEKRTGPSQFIADFIEA